MLNLVSPFRATVSVYYTDAIAICNSFFGRGGQGVPWLGLPLRRTRSTPRVWFLVFSGLSRRNEQSSRRQGPLDRGLLENGVRGVVFRGGFYFYLVMIFGVPLARTTTTVGSDEPYLPPPPKGKRGGGGGGARLYLILRVGTAASFFETLLCS